MMYKNTGYAYSHIRITDNGKPTIIYESTVLHRQSEKAFVTQKPVWLNYQEPKTPFDALRRYIYLTNKTGRAVMKCINNSRLYSHHQFQAMAKDIIYDERTLLFISYNHPNVGFKKIKANSKKITLT